MPNFAYATSGNFGIKCSALFSQYETRDREEIMDLLFRTQKEHESNLIEGLNSYFDLTWNSPMFKKYLARRSITWIEHERKNNMYSLVGDYVDYYLSRFENRESLSRYQNRVMRKFLMDRGITPTSSNSWREDLQRQSKTNVKRLLNRIGDFRPSFPEIVNAVNSIEMYLAHNSFYMEERPSYPLIASGVINQMGLKGFGANTADFNRFIGSDQHVYFLVTFKRKSDHNIAVRTEYGREGVVLKTDAAKKLAFVSPYIMYKEHLARTAELLDPDLAQRYISANTTSVGGDRRWIPKQNQIGTPELTREIQKMLGQLDFTFEDAEHLIKTYAIKRLHELKISDPVKFSEYMQDLKWGANDRIAYIIKEEVMKELGFSGAALEGRVPVAVPPDDLIYFGH